MNQKLLQVAIVVNDYNEAIDFYTRKLGFAVIEDTVLSASKRWVVLTPPGSGETRILLAKAATPEQSSRVGNQTGGRVFLFLSTDDFDRDYARLLAHNVSIVRQPVVEQWGKVAVFADLYGNLWDLIGPVPTT